MQVSIYSLKKILYDDEAKLINLKTSLGEITILDNHRPLISDILPCVLKIVDKNNQEHFFEIGHGFLEVNSLNQVKILIEEKN
ncbi:MAG: F0F1 ATP synthase subunit epsilon [Minisyncoccia bacterium]